MKLIQITEVHEQDAYYSIKEDIEGKIFCITDKTTVTPQDYYIKGFTFLHPVEVVNCPILFKDTASFYAVKYRVLFGVK